MSSLYVRLENGSDETAKIQLYNRMCPETARVMRDGRMMIVDAADLVVGDIVSASSLSHC